MTNPCVCKLVLSFILWATCDMADLNTAFQQTNSDEAHYHKFSLLRTWFYVILATSILCLKQRCILFTVFSFKLDKTLWILRSIQAHTDLRYLSNDRFHVDECRVFFAKSKVDFAEDHFFRPWFDVLLFAAFGLGGNLLSLYHVSAKVGVHQLTVNDLTDENKLLLCNKVLDDLDEGLECFAQVFVRECYMLSDVERES